ncbi:MAG: hypothetical protein HOO91_06070 [Bacteroidales bacterium]|nr:hypothetical protein [Bacteroidales bacterium]
MYKKLALLLIPLFISNFILGQSKYYDSLVIEFGKSKINSINLFVDTVIDVRNTKPSCLGVWEKKKYVFVPVDNFLQIQKPLATEIKGMFLISPNTSTNSKYRLQIDEFDVFANEKFFSKNFTCNASVSVYSLKEDNKYYYSGTLMYETTSKSRVKKKNIGLGYEDIIDKWKINFMLDIDKIRACKANDSLCAIPNYKRFSFPIKKNLYTNLESFIGQKSWLMDGEIIFSRPETEKKFYRHAYCIRYRNDEKYESFETSVYNTQQNIRISNKMVLILKKKLFFGLNRWVESEYAKHGLEDIFLVDFSLSQSITFNQLSKKGVIAGFGIMGNVNYIYSEGALFQPYLIVQLGIKL